MTCAVVLYSRGSRAAVHGPWVLDPRERGKLDYPEPVADHEEGVDRFRRFRESVSG